MPKRNGPEDRIQSCYKIGVESYQIEDPSPTSIVDLYLHNIRNGKKMNRYYLGNTPVRYGHGESRLQTHDLFMPPIHRRNEDCCFSHSRDNFLFPFDTSREGEELNPSSMKDGVDFLKLLGGVKDTAGSLICRHRSLRRSITDTSWTIRVLNQNHSPGDTLRFELFPNGSQACMVLQGVEIMESVAVLVAGDGTQKGIFFQVHMMHADHVETMNGDEVLDFLQRLLQCMDCGKASEKGVPTKDCHLKQKQAYSFIDERNDAVSAAACHRCNQNRFPRVRRMFRKTKLVSCLDE